MEKFIFLSFVFLTIFFQTNTARLFIALDISQTIDFSRVKSFISNKLKNKVKQSEKNKKLFIPEAHKHITLLFIGEVPQNKLGDVKCAFKVAFKQFLEEKTQSGQSLDLSLNNGLQFYGKNALVFEVNTTDNLLTTLTNNLNYYLKLLGVNPQFVQKPTGYHITIGRITDVITNNQNLVNDLKQNLFPIVNAPRGTRASQNESFTPSQVTLYGSTGRGYKALKNYEI